MTPLKPVASNPLDQMLYRQVMLNQPSEAYSGFFGGRVPTLAEKAAWVERSMQEMVPAQTWENDLYVVRVYFVPPFVSLDITRKDEQPCHNWRHFQQIKNQLVGPEHEAVELYPAERRLVDTANQYHLWVYMDPAQVFPFGFKNRWVLREPIRCGKDADGRLYATVASTVPQDRGSGATFRDYDRTVRPPVPIGAA